jgi:hypothetical protein
MLHALLLLIPVGVLSLGALLVGLRAVGCLLVVAALWCRLAGLVEWSNGCLLFAIALFLAVIASEVGGAE